MMCSNSLPYVDSDWAKKIGIEVSAHLLFMLKLKIDTSTVYFAIFGFDY